MQKEILLYQQIKTAAKVTHIFRWESSNMLEQIFILDSKVYSEYFIIFSP